MRICKLCGSDEVEDVDHFLLKCSHFNSDRINFLLNKLKTHFPNFDSLSESQKLFTLLNILTVNSDSINIICAYIKCIYEKRVALTKLS